MSDKRREMDDDILASSVEENQTADVEPEETLHYDEIPEEDDVEEDAAVEDDLDLDLDLDFDDIDDIEDSDDEEDDFIMEEINLDDEDDMQEDPRLIKHRKKKKRNRVILIVIAVIILAYAGVSFFFTNHFYPFTKINGTEFSAKTVSQVEQYMESQVDNYQLTLKEADGETETINGETIDLKYAEGKELETLLKEQNPFLWVTAFWNHPEIEAPIGVKYNKEKLSKEITSLTCMQPEEQVPSKSATPIFKDTEFVIEPEVVGTEIDKEKFSKAVTEAINGFRDTLDMKKEGCYILPKYTQESPEVTAAKDAMNSYLGAKVTYDFNPNTEVVDAAKISQWLTVDENMNVTFQQDGVKAYIQELAAKYDTYGKNRTITTSAGNTVEVVGGNYGWQIDQAGEYAALTANIQNAEVVTREPKYARRAASHGPVDFGNSYVELDLTRQHLWVYVNGQVVVETDVVTGNPNKGNGTPQGTYSIAYKQRDTTLRGPKKPDGTYEWESPVSYWMPFNGGIGLHDANWQPTFGGDWYLGHGSHGCVNLPPSIAPVVYNNINAGTPVICHY